MFTFYSMQINFTDASSIENWKSKVFQEKCHSIQLYAVFSDTAPFIRMTQLLGLQNLNKTKWWSFIYLLVLYSTWKYFINTQSLLLALEIKYKDGADKRLRHDFDLTKVTTLDASDVKFG